MIDLAHALGLCVVAEGVESVEQLERLRELGCDRAQGFFFSRSICSEDFVGRLTLEVRKPKQASSPDATAVVVAEFLARYASTT